VILLLLVFGYRDRERKSIENLIIIKFLDVSDAVLLKVFLMLMVVVVSDDCNIFI
jgi:hypothetical protein